MIGLHPVLTGLRIPEVSYERVGWSTWLGCPPQVFPMQGLSSDFWLNQDVNIEQESI